MSKAFVPVELGDRVKDPVTGFSGIANAIVVWLNGCIRVAVQPEKLDKDGRVREEKYFDQGALEILKKRVHEPMTLTAVQAPVERRRSNGGPDREAGNFRR